MAMTRSDYRAELQQLLHDAAKKFESPGDFDRHLDMAVADLPRVRPLIVPAELTLQADVGYYDAPSDIIKPLMMDWGAAEMRSLKPWDPAWPGRLPQLSLCVQSGVKQLVLSPPPTAHQISVLGTTMPYRYSALHTLSDKASETTINGIDHNLLLIRAAAFAMQELALNGAAKPVTLGSKAGISLPKNGTPQALSEQLLNLFEKMAA